jgi:hypothetical protein
MDGLTYTAPKTSCSDTVTVTSDSGAYGDSTVTVIDSISSFTVKKSGASSALTSLTLIKGESVSLDVSVSTYYGQKVYFSKDAFTYTVTGGVGTISSTGKFTATAAGAGNITVSYGGKTVTIPVTVCGKFYDVGPTYWARTYIEALADRGVIDGVTSTTFQPGSNITREAFCVMLSRYLGLDTSKYSSVTLPFTDNSQISSWATAHIKAMYALGYVKGSGTADGVSLDPKSNITRAEICTILGRIFGGTVGSVTFTDSDDIPTWAAEGVGQMAARGVVGGYTDGSFKPLNNATRAEVAKMIYSLQ